MIRKLLAVGFCLLFWSTHAFSQGSFGSVQGKILDAETGEPLIGANVVVIGEGGSQKGGASTDKEGNYTIEGVPAGTYDIKATYIGYQEKKITGIRVSSGQIEFIDIQMRESTKTLEEVEVVEHKKPLIEQDNNTTGDNLTDEEISKAPTRSLNRLAGLSAGTYTEGGTPSIRGQRTGGTVYYIDGVRVRGSAALPQSAISEIQTLTGGIPAEYGDATGGVISIQTKGPSREYHGGIDLITSQYLDGYGYNLLEGNVTGPIISKNKGTDSAEAKLGFLISGNISYQDEPNPSATDVWKVKDDVLSGIEEAPLRESQSGEGLLSKSEFVSKDQMEQIDARKNAENFGYNFTGKLDYQVNDDINLTAGGQLGHNMSDNYVRQYSLFNYENNPRSINNTYRGYVRYTQKFADEKEEDEDTEGLTVSNAFYNIQIDYTKNTSEVFNEAHGDDYFKYGHYGKYELYKAPSYVNRVDTINGRTEEANYMTGFQDTAVNFNPASYNTTAGNYTQQFFNLSDNPIRTKDQIQGGGGLLNGDNPRLVYSLWNDVGTEFATYRKNENEQFRVNASGSFNLNNHSIKLGVQYEQFTQRSFSVAGTNLWQKMRQLMNSHIQQLDTDNPQPVYEDVNNNGEFDRDEDIFLDTVNYPRLNEGDQATFDKNFRQKLMEEGATNVNGEPIGEQTFVNVDRYDPSKFSLDMFSADELLRTGEVSYYGYDQSGDKNTGNPSINDFVNNPDSRPMGSYNPIYVAGYVQDKFSFRDLIFRLGVRVDRFDANQPVLKDKYSLYPTRKKSEVDQDLHPNDEHPGNIGNNHVVYVDDPTDPTEIVGYRKDNNWFDASGSQIDDPNILAFQTQGGTIAPYLQAETTENLQISPESFKDYEPEVTVMPRIAFSFPISDEANFFANYDILTQRPQSGIVSNLDDYFYLEQRSTGSIANPGLKPQKRTNYEIGFKQKLTDNSALTLSAYYGEIRDLIQLVRVNQAFPISYNTFQNLDFGTVKGLTAVYDLREGRNSNATFQANYTLQFAESTGSNATDQASLISAGQPNLRTPFPKDNDVRHNLSTTFSYDFKEGKDYTGPITGDGTEILKNVGANLILEARSGKPYSEQSNVNRTVSVGIRQQSNLEGGINGARLPWNFNVDLRLDKDIKLTSQDQGGGQPTVLNVYFWIQNVFDTRNVLNVYSFTGDPDDDGFLSSREGQQVIESQVTQQAYRDQYSIKVNNPNNYSNPRLVRIGAQLNF